MENLRIVFMGTPDFAVGILDGLIKDNQNIVSVITVADKPAGRGQKINESAVKKYCVENNLPVLQPTNLKDESFIEELKSLNADLFVVVAFRMLPEIVWAMPPKGTINLHASLLPQYRGAAPINWVIINGEKETGVTTFFIEKEIDTGMIIERQAIEIDENQTAGELHDELMNIGINLVNKSVRKIISGEVEKTPQQDLVIEELKNAPKIFKEDCKIKWNNDVQTIHNFCRGLSPFPVAWTNIKNIQSQETKILRIYRTEKTVFPSSINDPIITNKNEILFPTTDFYLKILELQLEGKRKMTSKEFLAGNNFENIEISY